MSGSDESRTAQVVGAQTAGRSPLDVFEPEPAGRRRWPRTVGTVAAVLVVLGGAYVGAAYALADRVPRGTTVAGVQIGGLHRDRAVSVLADGLAGRTGAAISVQVRDRTVSTQPTTAGLTFDPQATVDGLVGLDLTPARLWRHLAGAGAVDPVTSVDVVALADEAARLADALSQAPVGGGVVFVDGRPHATPAAVGWQVDANAVAGSLRDDWLTAPRPVRPAARDVPADITQEETDAALRGPAAQVVAGPVVVEVAGQRAELPADVLAGAATFAAEHSSLVLHMDGAALVQAVTVRTTDLLTPAADARFEIVDDHPQIVPGTPGTTLAPDAVAAAVVAAVSATDRTARVELVATDPAATTGALEALGVTRNVAEFSTPLTSEPRRTVNITLGASKVNGTLVRPGETFSLAGTLGPIDSAHGYVAAGLIDNGEHVDGLGGGLSQLSTTTYNAAFFAGFEDVEHRPHTEYFSRYPEGREATLFTGSIDMRFRNNTPYGAVLQSWVAGGRLYVRVWSTPYWTVETSTSPRSAVVVPGTTYLQTPTCQAQPAGNPGFAVTVTRRVLRDGQVVTTERRTWRYGPQNQVICGPPPAG